MYEMRMIDLIWHEYFVVFILLLIYTWEMYFSMYYYIYY